MQELRSAIQSGDQERIRASSLAIGNAIAELAMARAKVLAQLKEILTPEQWQRFQSIRSRPFAVNPGPGPFAFKRPNLGPAPGRNRPQKAPVMPRPSAGPKADRLFEMMDLNGDGLVTRQELRRYQRALQPRPGL
jgi:hypothetical protein